ncbi:MAG: polysaccharide deacetylase family protein [Candidatus Aegiribacteria sp.]|nr:polysaccharide deacetylase family protein [Candidatus Aegiribacteria sp.]
MISNKGNNVPVIMYHSVVPKENLWSSISDPLDQFEKVLCNLTETGFHTIFLCDLYLFLKMSKRLPDKPIVLTFDDGYLDNWLHVFPLLKKYGQKATVFPALEFIADGKPRLLQEERNLEHNVGYMNWSELKIMQNSGYVDIQSHTMTHTWKFSSPEVMTFLTPCADFNWIEWNRDKSLKPFWEPHKTLPELTAGYPLFKYGRALGVREFIPNDCFVQTVIDTVSRNGGIDFLESHSSAQILHELVRSFSPHKRGRLETDYEFERRIDYELGESRDQLSSRLGKPVKFLCWPGGGWHPFIGDKWKKYGYLATSLPSNITNRKSNSPGDSPESFVRISSGLGEWKFRGKTVGRLNSRFFKSKLDHFFEIPGSLSRMRFVKLIILLRNILNQSRGSIVNR